MLPSSSLLDARRRQIDTLKVFNNNVIEVKPNDEYSVGFTADDSAFKLNVYLGHNFPNEKPTIVVVPRIQHDWISDPSTGEIQSAPGLLNFTIHSDLGRVVDAIIREFEKHPPTPWPLPNSSTAATPQHPQLPATTPDQPAATTPELCSLTLDELHRLGQDPQYLDDFIDEMNAIRRIDADINTLIDTVKTMAIENLSREQRVHELRASIQAKSDEFRRLGDSYMALNARYQQKSDEFAPQHIKELLQIAVSNADQDCDRCVDQFLGGTMDVQQFVDQYREAKRLSAMRKAKEERLTHQLNEFERATH